MTRLFEPPKLSLCTRWTAVDLLDGKLPGFSALRLHLHKPRHGDFFVIENGIAVFGLVTVDSFKDALGAFFLRDHL